MNLNVRVNNNKEFFNERALTSNKLMIYMKGPKLIYSVQVLIDKLEDIMNSLTLVIFKYQFFLFHIFFKNFKSTICFVEEIQIFL